MDWKNGRLKMKLTVIYQVCAYCLESFASHEETVNSPWVKHYLKSDLSTIMSNEYRFDSPFPLELSTAECVQVSKTIWNAELEQKVKDDTKTVKELLKGLVANPYCDVSKLEKEVVQIFGKASKSSSSKSSKPKGTKKSSSTGSSKSELFALYTNRIDWLLESVGDTEHRQSWKKDALISKLVDYPLADVLTLSPLQISRQEWKNLRFRPKVRNKI